MDEKRNTAGKVSNEESVLGRVIQLMTEDERLDEETISTVERERPAILIRS